MALQRGKLDNKRFIQAALAAGGLICAAPASALDLAIYGVGHVSGDRIDIDTSSSSYFHSNSSRLGFRGDHALGGGLTAIFQYESGVDLTGHGRGDGNGGATSGGQIFTRARDSFVGVKGGFGQVVFGRVGGLNQWLYDYNLFGDQVGDLGNIWGGDGLPGRLDHAAMYSTPKMGGFSAALTYAPDQGDDDSRALVAKVDFGTGPFKVSGAYGNFGNGDGSPETKAAAVTVSFDSGPFSVGGGYQRETDLGGISGADRDKYTVGATFKLGAGVLKAQYARADDLGDTSGTGAKQWAVGYDHAWDKATTVYVAYANTDNDSGAAYTSYNYGHGDHGVPGLLPGRKASAISVGLVYKFDVAVFPR